MLAHVRIPPQLILWGPFRAMWVFFQNRTATLEGDGEAIGFDPSGKHIVMVDDCVETGNSFRHVAEKLMVAGACQRTNGRLLLVADAERSRGSIASGYLPPPPVFTSTARSSFIRGQNNTIRVGEFDKWLAENGLELWK